MKNIFKLRKDQYEVVRHLFETMHYQLTANTVIDGTLDGDIYVDDINHPKSAYIKSPEGDFIVGDSRNSAFNNGLKGVISFYAYLQFSPEDWLENLPQIWSNSYAWKQSRTYMSIQTKNNKFPKWKEQLPDGYTLHQINREFMNSSIENFEVITGRINEWGHVERFFERAYGFCMVFNNRIVTRCIADNVYKDRTECGIWTERTHRGMGLASITVAAVVDYCRDNGLNEIGWHCLSNNIGSIKIAEKVGFSKLKEYDAYAIDLSAESSTDLNHEEWLTIAKKLDRIVIEDAFPDKGVGHIYAAEAWALAGSTQKSIDYLNQMFDSGWKEDYSFILDDWPFWGIHSSKEWKDLIAHRLNKSNII